MHRFFIPPDWLTQDTVAISGKLVHRLRNVLRLRPGDRIIVLDNSGWEYEVELRTITKNGIEGIVKGRNLALTEPRVNITLYQALLKSSRFEYILQKCTELGVISFVPTLCERSIAGNLLEANNTKLRRWQGIILEAAEQSRRGKLPVLHPAVPFKQACKSASGLSLLPWEEEKTVSLGAALHSQTSEFGDSPTSINLFIGPEGGFSPEEVEFARSRGIVPVSLGRRILRAETAGLVAASAILYDYGDLG